MPAAPSNFNYISNTRTLNWECSETVDEFLIEYSPAGQSNWQTAYQGPNLSCSFNQPSGSYDVKGKSKKEPVWSDWSAVETINVP